MIKKVKKTLDFIELVYVLITISFVCLSFVAIKNEIRFARDGYIVQGTITYLDWKPLGGHYNGNINDIPITVEYVNENGEKKDYKRFC